MTDDLNFDIAFLFLEEIKELFLITFSTEEINFALDHGFNMRFRGIIKQKIDEMKYQESDKIEKLKKILYEAKDEILQTDDIINDRTEKLNMIIKKVDNLKSDSFTYINWVKKTIKYNNFNFIFIYFNSKSQKKQDIT